MFYSKAGSCSWLQRSLTPGRACLVYASLSVYTPALSEIAASARTPQHSFPREMVLPRFLVPDDQKVLVPVEKMRQVTHQLMLACGHDEEGAAQCTDVLLKNDLRGNESHGVSNMLREYVSAYQQGLQNPTPEFKTLRETPGTALIDADGTLGIHAGCGAPSRLTAPVSSNRSYRLLMDHSLCILQATRDAGCH